MTCNPVKVPYLALPLQHQRLRDQLREALERVFNHGQFILGPELEEFEKRSGAYCGVKYAVGVANGTDALAMALRALGIKAGDEVITAPNSFLASASCIALAGARPVFVDVRDDYNIDPGLLEAAITARTRAIIPVHLTGRPADMTPIMEIAAKHDIYVIEDSAQAVGSTYKGQRVGSFGIAGCFSFHPVKNLGGCGDGGIITTNDVALYERLLKARNHGLRNRDECEFWSINSRLDTLQAAILNVKLNYLDEWIEQRRANAAFYSSRLNEVVRVPVEREFEFNVYHTFVIQVERRDELVSFLESQGIETRVHYPVPIHLQDAARYLGYKSGDFPVAEKQAQHILTLPIYPELTDSQKEAVVTGILKFYG